MHTNAILRVAAVTGLLIVATCSSVYASYRSFGDIAHIAYAHVFGQSSSAETAVIDPADVGLLQSIHLDTSASVQELTDVSELRQRYMEQQRLLKAALNTIDKLDAERPSILAQATSNIITVTEEPKQCKWYSKLASVLSLVSANTISKDAKNSWSYGAAVTPLFNDSCL